MTLSRIGATRKLPVLFVLGGLVCACGDGSGAAAGRSQTPGTGATGSATLTWSPPSKNQDGTPVGDIAGYYIYYGTKATQLDHVVKVSNPGLNSLEIKDLPAGTYYFSMTAYTSAGISGLASPLVSKTIR
jgi:hypothetical protein